MLSLCNILLSVKETSPSVVLDYLPDYLINSDCQINHLGSIFHCTSHEVVFFYLHEAETGKIRQSYVFLFCKCLITICIKYYFLLVSEIQLACLHRDYNCIYAKNFELSLTLCQSCVIVSSIQFVHEEVFSYFAFHLSSCSSLHST